MNAKVAVFAFFLAASWPAHSQDRAKTLHDTYCLMCHDTQVYTRADRLADNYVQIREQVNRWQSNASLNWSALDIDLVATYLAQKFYKTPCPMDC